MFSESMQIGNLSHSINLLSLFISTIEEIFESEGGGRLTHSRTDQVAAAAAPFPPLLPLGSDGCGGGGGGEFCSCCRDPALK